MHKLHLFWLINLLILASCKNSQSVDLPVSTRSTQLESATPAATLIASPSAEATARTRKASVEPSATDDSATTEQSLPESVSESSVFQIGWNDSSPYEPNLRPEALSQLHLLQTAPVYHLSIVIDEGYLSLQGKQSVRYTNNESVPLPDLVFRLFPNISDGLLQINSTVVDGAPVQSAYDDTRSVMTITLPSALLPGEQVVVDMSFEVTVPPSSGGNYGIFAYLDDVLALAHFYPMVAVFDDDGWDDAIPSPSGDVLYADASFYLVRVSAPDELIVAASGSAISVESEPNRRIVTYASGPARDFYLAGSSRYKRISREFDGITISSYALPEEQSRSEKALEFAVAAMEVFDRRFVSYPYTELDLVTTPTLALGIEYPGIIVATGRIYLDDPAQYEETVLESTIAHEVAHQWFYNIVGNDQIDEPWIDESVTQFATMLYFEERYGLAGYDGFRQSLIGRWESLDPELELPIGLPVAAYEGRAYSAMIYGRGPIFVEELAGIMGQSQFQAFMAAYTERLQWQLTNTSLFRSIAEEFCDCDLGGLFSEWIYDDS